MKNYISEFIGTFVLCFFACGVAAITGGNLVPTSLAFGFVIIAMAYSIGRISGCHINPAVSFGFFMTKKMSLKEFLFYSLSQVLGGLVGSILFFGIVKMAGGNLADTAASNLVVGNGGDYSFGGVIAAILTEVVLTCVFVYVILNVTDEKADTSKIAGIIIGLTLTLIHLVGIGLTGTSVNPARSIATAFANLIYNGSFKALSQVWIFIVAPIGGAAVAAILYNFLHKEKETTETIETEEVTEATE
ncbi:aquaporin [bacterium]|nr:aquaporin [bacterium]